MAPRAHGADRRPANPLESYEALRSPQAQGPCAVLRIRGRGHQGLRNSFMAALGGLPPGIKTTPPPTKTTRHFNPNSEAEAEAEALKKRHGTA